MNTFTKLTVEIYLNDLLYGLWLVFAPSHFTTEEINDQISEVETQIRVLCQNQGI